MIDGYLNYFPFDDDWILNQRFNWEQNIQVATNRKFDQFSLLNQPMDKDEYNTTTFYVHGVKFKEDLNDANLQKKNYIINVPYFVKLPSNAHIRFTRNSNIKD